MKFLCGQYPGIFILVLLLGGCGSTPESRYYRLSTDSTPGNGAKPSLGVGPITVAEYLNRNNLVYSESDNSLDIAAFERWAEPLPQGVQRVVSLNLSERLDTQNLRAFPWSASQRPDFAIQLWVLSMDASDSELRMTVEWRLWQPTSGKELQRGIEDLRKARHGGDGGAVAAGFSELLGRLSDRLASAVRRQQTAGPR